MCHSPAEEVRWRVCAGGVPLLGAAVYPWRSPRWAEGGALEGCTEGVYRMSPVSLQGGVAVGSLRRWFGVGADWLSTWGPSQLVWWLLERSPEEGGGSVYGFYGGFQRWCFHATSRNPHPYTTSSLIWFAVVRLSVSCFVTKRAKCCPLSETSSQCY